LPEPSTPAVVLDTDVASRSFKGLLSPKLAARLAGRQPLLTFVTIGELTQWTKLRPWGPRNRSMLETWLADKPVIPAGKSIAVIWGELSAGATQRGRPRPVNDTWVAACCLNRPSHGGHR
jgi:predicted nucleic acid-binding protein